MFFHGASGRHRPRSRGSSPTGPVSAASAMVLVMNGLRSFSARDFDDSGTAVMGLGLLARVDDRADEATTDEGWDGEVALLEDALRYVRMVSVAYGHLVGDPMMFTDLDTSS